MYQFQKHFTLAEARALLPKLRRLFQDIHRRRQEIVRAETDLARSLPGGGDVGGPTLNGMLMDLAQLNRQLQHLGELGVQIKDVDRGLVDFPHLRADGQEVFLCWELEEDDIEFWHDLDTGYAGREQL